MGKWEVGKPSRATSPQPRTSRQIPGPTNEHCSLTPTTTRTNDLFDNDVPGKRASVQSLLLETLDFPLVRVYLKHAIELFQEPLYRFVSGLMHSRLLRIVVW